MSTITEIWTEEKIRSIIRKLDEQTGLNGATLPIAFNSYGWFLGHYRHVEPKAFGFNRKFFNDPFTKEAEVVDVIRHEYAHYYVDAANLEKYIGHSRRETSHGSDWKWACKMVGADPTRCHNVDAFYGKNWTVDEAQRAYNADDVIRFDIQKYLNLWGNIPMDPEKEVMIANRIKESNPNSYYDIGDEVLHPKQGFGVVFDTIICDYTTQKLYVLFEDNSEGVFNSKELCKIVEGVAIPYHRKR